MNKQPCASKVPLVVFELGFIHFYRNDQQKSVNSMDRAGHLHWVLASMYLVSIAMNVVENQIRDGPR